MKDPAAREKIRDPAAHADRVSPGPFFPWRERDLWGEDAAYCTTVGTFGRAGGVRWYRNCGPTAVTNLLVTLRHRMGEPVEAVQSLYARVARYGTSRLLYWNTAMGPVGGTSDLLAGVYLRRMLADLPGPRPAVRLRPARAAALAASLDRGALLYLVLHRHPAYGSHHLVCYGWRQVKSRSTGEVRTYLKVADGHAPAPRYLDLAACRSSLLLYYEVLPAFFGEKALLRR